MHVAHLFGQDAQTDPAMPATVSLADRFGNTREASLHVHGEAVEPCLKPGRPEATTYPSSTHAMRQLVPLLARAATVFEDRPPQPVADMPRAGALAGHPVFLRSLLEQAFLSLYLDEDEPALLAGLIEAHPFPWSTLPERLRHELEDALRVVLQATAFSFHLGFEDTLRQGQKRQKASRQAARALALELFALWWWANPDLVGLERRGGGERFLPLNRRAHRTLAGQTGGGGAARPRLAQEELFDDRLDRLLTASGAVRHDAGVYTATPTFRAELASTGGFLSCSVVFSEPFRHGLARLWAPVPSKAHYITCALLPRVVELALSSDGTDADARGQTLVDALFAEWIRPVLCGPADVAVAEAPESESATHWAVLFASLAATAALKTSTVPLRRSRKTLQPERAASYGACLAQVEADYVRRLAAIVDVSDDYAWARRLFRTCALSFEAAGVFQSRLHDRPPTPNALQADVTARLARTFPEVFQPGRAVTALWVLASLEHLTVPLTFAQETALDRWRCGAVCADHGHSDGWGSAAEEGTVAPPCAALATGPSEGVHVPTWSRTRRTQWVTHALVQDTASAEARASATGGASPGQKRGAKAALDHALLPSFTSSWPLLRSSLSVAEWTTREGWPSPMHEVLQETQSAAVSIFQTYTTTPTVPTTTIPTAAVSPIMPLPSLYVFLRLMHFLARAGAPPAAAPRAALSPLVDAVQTALLPECHRVLRGSLEKTLAAYVAHSAGPASALALLTTQRALVDGLPSAVAWTYLVESLLWSGLPSSALDGAAEGAHTARAVHAPACFGLGSLAWDVLRLQQPLLLALQTPTATVEEEGEEGEETSARTGSVGSAHAPRVLLTTLTHLVALALQTPEATPLPVALLPSASHLAGPSAPVPPSADTWPAQAPGERAPTRVDGDDEEEGEAEDTSEDALWLGTSSDGVDTAWADDVADDDHAPDSGTATASPSRAATRVLDKGSSTPAHMDRRVAPGRDEAARAAFAAALGTAAPRSAHLFHSLVLLLSWATAAPSALLPDPQSYGRVEDGEVTAMAACYVALVGPLLPGGAVPEGWCRVLGQRRLAELVCLTVIHSVPDVWWLSCLLVRWQGADSTAHGEPLPGCAPRPPRVLTKRLEASLAQLLHHGGVRCADVHRWRARRGVDGDALDGALADACGFHARVLSDAVRDGDAGEACSRGDGHSTDAHEGTRWTSELTCLLGSLLLASFETRARQWRTRPPTAAAATAVAATARVAEIARVLHPHNHYLSCFFGTDPASEDTLRAVWPSRQLFSFRPSTSSAFNVLPMPDLWQRDGRRLVRGAPPASTVAAARLAAMPSAADSDATYVSLFAARPSTR